MILSFLSYLRENAPINTREETYHITEKEMTKLKMAEKLVRGEITVKNAAEVLKLFTRQVARIKKGTILDGLKVVIHGNRDRKPKPYRTFQ